MAETKQKQTSRQYGDFHYLKLRFVQFYSFILETF